MTAAPLARCTGGRARTEVEGILGVRLEEQEDQPMDNGLRVRVRACAPTCAQRLNPRTCVSRTGFQSLRRMFRHTAPCRSMFGW